MGAKSMIRELWLKHWRVLIVVHVLAVAAVAVLYWAETSMVLDQIDHLRSQQAIPDSAIVEALAGDLAVVTPGLAADHGLGLIMGTVIGTVLFSYLGARVAAIEFRWRTMAGFASRFGSTRSWSALVGTAIALLLSISAFTVLAAWVSASIASGALSAHFPAFAQYAWVEPSGPVLGQWAAAALTRSLEMALAFFVGSLTRSTLASFAVPVLLSLGEQAVSSSSALASYLPSVLQASVWPQILRYPPQGGLIYSPIAATDLPLSITLPTLAAISIGLFAASIAISARRELRT